MIETLSVLPRKSSATFGNFRKMFGNVRLALGQLLTNLRKSSENRQKRRYWYVYIIKRILHARLWIQILSSRVQLDSSTRYRVEHSKIKFVSTRRHVISSIYVSILLLGSSYVLKANSRRDLICATPNAIFKHSFLGT